MSIQVTVEYITNQSHKYLQYSEVLRVNYRYI